MSEQVKIIREVNRTNKLSQAEKRIILFIHSFLKGKREFYSWNGTIAYELNLSYSTVANYISSFYSKGILKAKFEHTNPLHPKHCTKRIISINYDNLSESLGIEKAFLHSEGNQEESLQDQQGDIPTQTPQEAMDYIYFLELMKPINPLYKYLANDNRQKKAAEQLYTTLGAKGLEELIRDLPNINIHTALDHHKSFNFTNLQRNAPRYEFEKKNGKKSNRNIGQEKEGYTDDEIIAGYLKQQAERHSTTVEAERTVWEEKQKKAHERETERARKKAQRQQYTQQIN